MECNQTLWLDISEEGQRVRQMARLANLSLGLSRRQCPSMILVFESSQKQFFPKDERSGVYLRLEHENGRNNPVFVASMQITSPQWRNRDDPSNDHGCSVTQEITMRGDSTDQPVPKLLFPFVHTLIFLYKDDRDTERIKAQVQYWKDVHDKVHKQFSMPEILICTWDHSQLRRLRQDLHSIVQREPQRRFSARRRSQHSSISQHRISQHRVSSRHITPFRITVHRIDWRSYSEDGLRPICNQARLALERSRQRRKASKMLFSPKHFSKFFSYSMTIHSEIQEQKQYKPFCFIGASRTGNPVTSDYEQHLKNFIFVLPDDADPDFISETLASRFLFDHWSKNMHHFHTKEVFRRLYEGLYNVLAKYRSLPSCSEIVNYMELLENECDDPRSDIFGTLQSVMRKHRSSWQKIGSGQETCFNCLRRRPEYKPECPHMICPYCMWELAIDLGNNDRLLPCCLLCGKYCGLRVHFRSPTAAVGGLCMDGGGVRGVVPTEILDMLYREIGLPIHMQDHIQMACGVSAGALNIIGLFSKGLPPSACTKLYEGLAGKIFKKRFRHRIPLLSLLLCLLDVPIYAARAAKEAFIEAYGADATLLKPSFGLSVGTRIILPVATVRDTSLIAFTNYNGAGNNKMRLDYRVHDNSGDVSLSDLAASCTAAPIYFPLVYLNVIGEKVQDPGLIENNAVALLQSEMNAYYGTAKPCQFLLNIGTGSFPSRSTHRHASVIMWVWDRVRDSAASRLVSSYCRLISGAPTWNRWRRGWATGCWMQDRYIRLDTEFDTELRLDDIRAISKLKARVRSDPILSTAIKKTALVIKASLFFFELDSLPRQHGRKYTATGTIIYRCRRGDPALQLLIEEFTSRGAKFVINGSDLPNSWVLDAGLKSITGCTGGFAMSVPLHLSDENFQISIRWPNGSTHPISGSPFSLSRLIQEQGLDNPFGLVIPGYTPPPRTKRERDPEVPSANKSQRRR